MLTAKDIFTACILLCIIQGTNTDAFCFVFLYLVRLCFMFSSCVCCNASWWLVYDCHHVKKHVDIEIPKNQRY